MSGTHLSFIVVAGGPLILMLVIVYVLLTRRRRGPAERRETVAGEPPEIFPFLGSSRLAETIDRFKVSAVVHGHAHRGSYEGQTPGGAKVYNVAMHITKPTGRPYALLEI